MDIAVERVGAVADIHFKFTFAELFGGVGQLLGVVVGVAATHQLRRGVGVDHPTADADQAQPPQCFTQGRAGAAGLPQEQSLG